jgi:predicted nuclease of predicted toxin-antitoxin system
MRFLADMGVDIRVVDWLRDRGHEALHLREHGMHRASDQTIFAKAMAEDRIVITFDLDFGTLAALAGDRSPSIVLFRLSNARLATVIARLGTVLVEAGRACPCLGHSRRGHPPADPGSPDRRSLIPRPRGALLLTSGC